MSTPLLPEVVPEIDANPVSFYREEGGVVHGLEFVSPFNSDILLFNCSGSVVPSKRLGLQFKPIYF